MTEHMDISVILKLIMHGQGQPFHLQLMGRKAAAT
eukprot:CAMPEP_0172806298 /NCGR_PEP_ID=MMETSP1075-20121228/6267_1 /TAXON_ID=2916 /ORGANISM="Ceratium fusus, Strain PA161109" /LENGTH=34 /DNA_ID= /DNA_START= /DNA_END= /DNA_ORIENTATION=